MQNCKRYRLFELGRMSTSLRTLGLLPCLLVISALVGTLFFGTAQPARAQSPTIFTVPHEIMRSGMLFLDLNGDGALEIITASVDGYLTVLHGSTYDVIWDKNLADYLPNYNKTRVQSSLAMADLDNDGRLDIVIATGGADPVSQDGPGAIIVLTVVGGADLFELMPGWPVFARDALGPNSGSPDGHPDGFYSTPALGDIDGDGDMEIVIGGMDRSLHAFHHNGTYVAGWPMDRSRRIWRESRSTAALADMDGDGVLDILIGSNSYGIPSCANPYHFYGLKGDSTLLPGFPISTTQNIESSPAIGDINNDGSLDIVFGTGDFNENCGQQSNGKKVYAVDRFGNALPGWPVSTNDNTVNSPALGDLNNDGVPEIVINTNDTLYAWHGDGTLVQGFPVNGDFHLRHASPVLADIDGDSQVEIVLASGQVFGPNGELEQHREKLQSQVVVIDQDGDGLLETIGFNHYNYDRGLHLRGYIFQETGPATSAQPWPMFHRSPDRRGVLPHLFTLSGRVVDASGQGVAGVKLTLDSGQVARTNANGVYEFGSLAPGDYTITPEYQDYLFTPAQRSATLSGNTTVQEFVMQVPAYDIYGKVMHPNGSPMAGVTVQLNGRATLTTGKDGSFSFEDRPAGQYTLAPISPALNYVPAKRTFKAEDKQPQNFYALPNPVADTLRPNNTTVIEFMDTQGLPTRILFPQGLGRQEAVVTPVLPEDPNGYLFAGHAVHIELASDATSEDGVIGQNGELLSLAIEIQYNDADLRSLLDAEELTLMWKSPDGWIDAQATCTAGSSAEHNLRTQTITVPVCQWGTYGLFAPVERLFMPTLLNEE